jgi:hypothetical protein
MTRAEATLLNDPIGSVLYDLVHDALATQRVKVSEDTGLYLTSLLSAFLRTNSERFSRVLGVELLKADDLEPARRYAKLKDIADTSLFLAGIFLDHLEAQLPTTDYYFEVGSTAYLKLGSGDERHPLVEPFVDTYRDLGKRFEQFVRVLSAMADSELFASNSRVVGLYERWLRCGTSRDAHRLIALGLIPGRADFSKTH